MLGLNLTRLAVEAIRESKDPLSVDTKECEYAAAYNEKIEEFEKLHFEQCNEFIDDNMLLTAGCFINGDHFPRNLVIASYAEQLEGGTTFDWKILHIARKQLKEWHGRSVVMLHVSDKKDTRLVFERRPKEDVPSQIRGKRKLDRHFRKLHEKLKGMNLTTVAIDADNLETHLAQVDEDREAVRRIIFQ